MGMAAAGQFPLHRDTRGALWDLLLYVPTVIALASVAAKLWFGDEHSLAYLLAFLASFFCIAGANRILKTRLMLLPAAPVRIEVGRDAVCVHQRNGQAIDLVKDQRVYGDLAGRSFGLTGLGRNGQRLQFVFHRGQFADEADFARIREALGRLARGGKSAPAKS
jgi:hypothetical protein